MPRRGARALGHPAALPRLSCSAAASVRSLGQYSRGRAMRFVLALLMTFALAAFPLGAPRAAGISGAAAASQAHHAASHDAAATAHSAHHGHDHAAAHGHGHEDAAPAASGDCEGACCSLACHAIDVAASPPALQPERSVRLAHTGEMEPLTGVLAPAFERPPKA